MRSLGSLSSGTSSPAWASQFNRLSTRCLRGLARKQPSFVCTSTGASRTGRLDGVLLLLEVKALAHPDACVRSVCQYPLSRGSFFNERSELLSFGYVCTYGCFISLGLHVKRSLTIVAGKKGKKADRDVLVKEREDDVEEDKRSSEQHEESAKGKKLKAKKKHDDDQQLDNADATAEHASTESPLKSKKKKLKELSQNGDVLLGKFSKEEDKDSQPLENQKQEEAEAVVNGALRGEDPKVQDKQKDKKKLKSKAAKSEEDLSYEDSGVTKDDDIRVETKSKNKRSTQKSEEVLDSDAGSAVNVTEANVSAFVDGETFQEFKDAEQLANVVETELAEELDDLLDDDYFWEDDFEPEPEVGDGGEGGGVVFGDSSWGPKALNLANDVLALFKGGLAIFSFKVYEESDLIQLRLDKLSDKYVNHNFFMCLHYTSSMVFIGHLSFVNLIVYGC